MRWNARKGRGPVEEDSPETEEVQPPDKGIIAEIPKVGGFHHRYKRRAA